MDRPIILTLHDFGNQGEMFTDNGSLINSDTAIFIKSQMDKILDFNRKNNITDEYIEKDNVRMVLSWMDRVSENAKNAINYKCDGYVYLIKSQLSGLYKIGCTTNPEKRLKLIKVIDNSCELIYLHCDIKDQFKAESKLHGRFKDKRVHGEWFKLEDSDISIFKNFFNGK